MTQDLVPSSPNPEAYLRGIALFNQGEFFEAHEAWEDLWRISTGASRTFLQGLIQCAVALEHYRRGNLRGAQRLSHRYPEKFKGLPPIFMRLDIAQFLAEMHATLLPILASEHSVQVVALDPARLPTIRLVGR